jgi:hypothetical protein
LHINCLGLRCHYKAHLTTRPDQKKLYITALEGRVAQLESLLSNLGQDGVGVDHWKDEQHEFQGENQVQEEAPIEETEPEHDIRNQSTADLANASYASDEHALSSSRLFGSVIRARKSPPTGDLSWEKEHSKLVPKSELVEKMGRMFVSPLIAPKLLDTWIKHFSTHYPVIHTHRLKDLHARRDGPLEVFQESILHLVYAISGQLLEAVSTDIKKKVYALISCRQETQANFTQDSITMLHFRTWTQSWNFGMAVLRSIFYFSLYTVSGVQEILVLGP